MKYYIVYILLLMSSVGVAQKVWEKDLATADAFMEQHVYSRAIEYYEKVVQVKKNSSVYLNLGEAHFRLREFKEASLWWGKLQQMGGVQEDSLKLKIAEVQFSMGDMVAAGNLLEAVEEKESAQYKLVKASIDSVGVWGKEKVARVQNLRLLNSTASDVAPVFSQGSLVFSSDREGVRYKRSFEQTGNAFFKLYASSPSKKKTWSSVESFSSEINSNNHEGAACFSSEGDEIYFTRSEFSQGENLNQSDQNQLKLYKSTKEDGRWSEPLWFMMNDSLNSFGHPCLSEDGSIFFFVSDMPGGYGGTDLYMSLKLTDTTWSAPINLGERVNSERDELYPFYSQEEKVLYFSSNGHPGYGAFDLYKTSYADIWQTPQNLGYGLNSAYDDLSLSLMKDGKGFFSSNRPGGKGMEDLYLFLIK